MGKSNPKNWSSSNWLKFGTDVGCYMLISILMFINLTFSKLTEIWYRGTLLYVYYNFNGFFYKILFIHFFFEQIWSQNVKFFKLTEIWYRGRLLYGYFNFIVFWFFSKFLSFIFSLGKFGPKIWSSWNWLKCRTGVHCYMLITILMLIFSKF